MDKKTYYVSVQADTILENQGDAAYEFEIQATQDEVNELFDLLEEKREFEDATFIRAHIPGVPYHQDLENDGYDEALRKIYARIHTLGNDEAKRTIESMGLDGLGTPYPSNPG